MSTQTQSSDSNISVESQDDQPPSEFHIDQDLSANECAYCFCRPCTYFWHVADYQKTVLHLHRQSSDSNISVESQDDQPPSEFHIDQDLSVNECAYCFCRPCITSETNRQLWWETDEAPHSGNNHGLRKEKYKRFWTMMFHWGVWDEPRYKRKNSKHYKVTQDSEICMAQKRHYAGMCSDYCSTVVT